MRIGIVGHKGVVGSTLDFGFTKLGHETVGYDIVDKNTSIKSLLDFRPPLIFVAVPTPVSQDGSCNTEILRDVIEDLILEIRDRGRYFRPSLVIKSTVPPGTTQLLINDFKYEEICFCPEFLRERCALTDFVELHNLLAVGTYSDEIFKKVVDCHGNYPKNTVKLTPTEAEFLKYYHNAVAALRIIFANEMYDLAGAIGIDYIAVKNALLKSSQLPDKYFDVSKNMRGFAGVCLPKDTLALLKVAEQHNVDLDLLESVVVKNQKYQPTVYPGMRA